MYCYNEYTNDIFKTNKTIHYENILKNAHFKIIDNENIKNNFTKEKMNELKDDRNEQYDNLFDEYINANENDKTKNKFETINNNIKVLNLPMNKDILTQYKEYLMNPFKLNDHMNIIRILKSNEYIKNKLHKINEKNQKVKTIDNIYNKI